MSDSIDLWPDSASRRTVLQKSAATGALFVGGTAITGSATAHPTGGNAVMFAPTYRHRTPFEVVARGEEPLELPASCRSFDSTTKEWDVYTIEYDENTGGKIDVRAHKGVHIGDEYEFTNGNPIDCEPPGVVKAAFKPVHRS